MIQKICLPSGSVVTFGLSSIFLVTPEMVTNYSSCKCKQKEERGEVGSSLWTLGSRPLPTHAHTSTHMHAQAHGHVPMSGEALFFSDGWVGGE